MNAWSIFFGAEVGATAALTGLIFVGVSLNLTKILSRAVLPLRALEAMVLLISTLVISSLMLVPGQSEIAVGLEVLVLGSALWAAITTIHVRICRQVEPELRKTYLISASISQLTVISYFVAGVLILSVGWAGVYGLVPATLLSIVKANLDAWVLLVEINR